ncbi:hypothetical protein [Sorangium sp. So ce513]|uniref:hypothetical protein n=1 Tax=Sorangium sp. So ce513 TaxID=3133315 RepID=UPI003F6305C3
MSWTREGQCELDRLRGKELTGTLTELEQAELATLMARVEAEEAGVLAPEMARLRAEADGLAAELARVEGENERLAWQRVAPTTSIGAGERLRRSRCR